MKTSLKIAILLSLLFGFLVVAGMSALILTDTVNNFAERTAVSLSIIGFLLSIAFTAIAMQDK